MSILIKNSSGSGEDPQHWADIVDWQNAHIDDIRYILLKLTTAEHQCRFAHDNYGDSDIRTGRAWDLMRRNGDATRAYFEGQQ